MPTFQKFQEFELRIGQIIEARVHPTARKPSYQLVIDFGRLGTRTSSAQITKRYQLEELIGLQVTAVVNFPPRRIGDFTSEVLVLGAVGDDGEVTLLTTTKSVPNGLPIA
jgi:tRNA-binding protein